MAKKYSVRLVLFEEAELDLPPDAKAPPGVQSVGLVSTPVAVGSRVSEGVNHLGHFKDERWLACRGMAFGAFAPADLEGAEFAGACDDLTTEHATRRV